MFNKMMMTATVLACGTALGSTRPLLNAGDTHSLSGTTSSADADAYGTLLYGQNDAISIGPGVYVGTLLTRVIENSAGELVFELELIGDSPIIGLDRITYSGFAGTDLWSEWKVGAGDLSPGTVSRSSDGDSVDWSGPWAGNIYHHNSESMFAVTDATAYSRTGGVVRIMTDWGAYQDVVVAAPMIPAPGAMALVGIAGCLAGSRRRRRG
ncbi:MAG: hypothetical protein MK116_10415 [Phycisphaerales bacterium]|nr:hypothetical protein [Phycisphaerales bacterium]